MWNTCLRMNHEKRELGFLSNPCSQSLLAKCLRAALEKYYFSTASNLLLNRKRRLQRPGKTLKQRDIGAVSQKSASFNENNTGQGDKDGH